MRIAMNIAPDGSRPRADLRDPASFDHVGRDAGANFAAGEILAELADSDPRIVVGCADLTYVTRLAIFGARHPKRLLYYGISERNMLGAAAGLATTGHIPYMCTFASFSAILGYENIRTDLAYPRLPVRILATHAGLSMGFFGTSHHATEDLAALRAVAGLRIVSPCDPASTRALIRQTVDEPGPVYFRIGRGRESAVYDREPRFEPGLASVVRDGSSLLIVATGIMVQEALAAAETLAGQGISATVVDVHTIKPFPDEHLAALAARHQAVLTVEEHTIEGGLGTMTVEALAAHGVRVPLFKHGLRDEYALVGPPTRLYRYYGLEREGIALVGERLLAHPAGHPVGHPVGPRLITEPLWTADDRARVYAQYGVRK
ncbi:MAG TPA: transketolase C-terminal domain-containing protein [Trebonia sp.]|jgi:transketolase|nr:transketolase C-terminal domain-containing protein [Trebonia sp.]